jgi:ubiquinol-cytochrome c reductase cytochrome b subunit
MKAIANWFDNRTGYRALVHEALYESIPGGSRWRYVWGSTLVFTFVVQLITGTFLWMAYSPSAQTAWESVYYIQHEMQGGWLLRGVHHFTAQAMIVLLALHLMQVVIDGAYRAPREVNFWLGLILMQIVLGLSLTGYLLPWDQKGYWATQVATKIAGTVPVAGETLQRLVVGGREYGHHTLSRFFALHAGVLPGLLIFFLVLHLALFRKHGIKARKPDRAPDQTFWPDQILKDAVACLAVLAVVLGLVKYLGADLGAPADPANNYSAARPEWYFLFLFQLLKFFPGESEVIGAVVIPGAVMLVMFLMPFLGKWKLGHGFNIALVCALLAGAVWLTFEAVTEDKADLAYRNAVWEAEQFAVVAHERAKEGIPVEGAARMLRQEPKAVALRVITRQCLGCHSYTDPAGHGYQPEKPEAPNLYAFGSREWARGLLDAEQIAGPHYFGGTAFFKDESGEVVSEMANWVKDNIADIKPEDKDAIVAALSAEAALPSQAEIDARDAELIDKGRELIASVGCTDCHKFRDNGDLGSYPDLTGWGSREWLIEMIANPAGDRHYVHLSEDVQKMPAFQDRLSEETIGLIADWLRGEWPGRTEPTASSQPVAPPPAGTP